MSVRPAHKINEDQVVINMLKMDKHKPNKALAIGKLILLINFSRNDCTEIELSLIRAGFNGRYSSVGVLGV